MHDISTIWHYSLNRLAAKILSSRNFFCWSKGLPVLLRYRDEISKDGIELAFSLLKEDDDKVSSARLSSTNSINLTTAEYFYKIPITKNCEKRIESEFYNWNIINQDETVRDYFVSGLSLEGSDYGIRYIKMPLLAPRDNMVESFVQEFLLEEKKLGNKSPAQWSDDMKKGYETLKRVIPDRLYFDTIDCIMSDWEKRIVSYGFTHGDLHNGNVIMQDNRFVLIDTDRCVFNGAQDFDGIHFALASVNDKGYLWMSYLAALTNEKLLQYVGEACQETNLDIQLKTAYWLDRVGKEYKYGQKMDKYYVNQIYSFLQFIICEETKI